MKKKMWEHRGEKIQKFLEALNYYFPTTVCTAEYPRKKISVLDITIG